MSVELVLIPVALAAITSWKAGRADRTSDGKTVCSVSTRMRDQGLLEKALSDTRAVVQRYDDRLVATWEGVQATFVRREDGVWSAHLEGAVDESRAIGIVMEVDRAYGRQVQAVVLERIRTRAPSAGLQVQSETRNQENDVTFVLTTEGA